MPKDGICVSNHTLLAGLVEFVYRVATYSLGKKEAGAGSWG